MSAILKFDFQKKKSITFFWSKLSKLHKKRPNFACDNYIFPKTRGKQEQCTHYSTPLNIQTMSLVQNSFTTHPHPLTHPTAIPTHPPHTQWLPSVLNILSECRLHVSLFDPTFVVVTNVFNLDLRGHNWQKWKRVFLTCPCHEIYRDEAVGLKSCKNTWKITIFVKMWNLGQYRENLIFCQ